MVQHPFPDTGSSCTVKVYGSNHSRIVGNKEITVYGREQGYQHHWRNAQSNAQRHNSAHSRRLTVKQNRHYKQCHTEKPRHLTDNSFNRTCQFCYITINEGIPHPCDTENSNHCLHPCRKYTSLSCLDTVSTRDNQNECGSR